MTKRAIKVIVIILLVICLLVAIAYGSQKMKEAENARLISEYCSFSTKYSVETSSIDDLVRVLMSLDTEYSTLQAAVNKDFPSWRDESAERNKLLLSVLADRKDAIVSEIMAISLFDSSYSNVDILTTIETYNSMLHRIVEQMDKKEYDRAFATFIKNNSHYSDDCIHYIVNTAYPEIFSLGLREHLLDVGVIAWSDEGELMLANILSYIDSMPSGRNGLQADIATAEKQLAERTAQYIADETRRMKETTSGYPFYIGMRESELRSTILGAPDSVEKCRDFDVLVARARHKTYKWEMTAEHGWYKITVRYRRHNSRRFDDYEDLPADNGYVTDITWVPEKGKTLRSVSITDQYD